MCGICGFIDIDLPQPERRVRLQAMLAAMDRRGRESGTHLDETVALGCRRLPLVDIARGHQPIRDERERIRAVVNGEITNSIELRRELEGRGHRFRSESDAEVVVHLYEEDGIDFLARLEGMFAVALWDGERRRLVLGRDPVGIKPLFIAEEGGGLWFASSIPALLAGSHLPRDLDETALIAYCHLQYVPRPHTIYRHIRALLPGQRLVRQGETHRIDAFRRWEINTCQESTPHLADAVRNALTDSVQRCLMGETRKGVLLSGGVDSSAIAVLAARHIPQLPTYAAVFDETSFDERNEAARVARFIGSDHHEVEITADGILDALPTFLAQMGEPFAEGSALPLFLVCARASEDVPVLLSGEGSDELFGGYETYRAHLIAKRWSRLPAWMRTSVTTAAARLPVSHRKLSWEFRLKRFLAGAHLPPWQARLLWKGTAAPETIRSALALPPDRIAAAWGELDRFARDRYEHLAHGDELARLGFLDFSLSLPDDLLMRADLVGMAHTVEIRVPVLSSELVRLGLGLPEQKRATTRRDKILWRQALEPILPPGLAHRRKRGLNLPYAQWLCSPRWQQWLMDAIDTNTLEISALFHKNALRRLADEHFTRRRDHGHLLWTIGVLHSWKHTR